MVAIRHSHELNPATFELAGWSESLHMLGRICLLLPLINCRMRGDIRKKS